MNLFEIIIFTAWTLSSCGIAYGIGFDRKCREVKAKEIVDELEDV